MSDHLLRTPLQEVYKNRSNARYQHLYLSLTTFQQFLGYHLDPRAQLVGSYLQVVPRRRSEVDSCLDSQHSRGQPYRCLETS